MNFVNAVYVCYGASCCVINTIRQLFCHSLAFADRTSTKLTLAISKM